MKFKLGSDAEMHKLTLLSVINETRNLCIKLSKQRNSLRILGRKIKLDTDKVLQLRYYRLFESMEENFHALELLNKILLNDIVEEESIIMKSRHHLSLFITIQSINSKVRYQHYGLIPMEFDLKHNEGEITNLIAEMI